MQIQMPERLGAFEYRRQAVVLPTRDGERDPVSHRVVIAGGGPVGLALALGLARFGVPSLVLEADESVCVGSRAICLSRRSLEILDALGVLNAFVDKGLAWTGGRSFWRDTEVLHFLMPHDADQRLAPMTNIEQYYIEQFLLDGIARYPDQIEVRWGTRVVSVNGFQRDEAAPLADETSKDGVELMVEAAGQTYALRTDWLVACDGARSTVRERLGLRMSGTSYEGRYVIVDIEADLGLPTERLAWFDPPANPGRTVLMHRQPDGLWRIDYQLRPGEDPDEAVRAENVFPVVRSQLQMLGYRGDWKPVWISIYRANAVSLDRYRHGRVLFAGDAAHLVPIFGVRGLNSGFEDAWNLVWKLARVAGEAGAGTVGAEHVGAVSGADAEVLLDSYSLERRHAWQRNIEQATKSTEFMAPPSRGFELMRDAVLSLAAGHPALRSLINPRQASSIPYPESPLNTPDRNGDFDACAGAPGEVLAECPLREANGEIVHLTRLLALGFTGLLYGVAERLPDSQLDEVLALSRRMPGLALVAIGEAGPVGDVALRQLEDHAGRFRDLYDARPGSFWLVRPDGHVCARWRATDAAMVAAAMLRAGARVAMPAEVAA